MGTSEPVAIRVALNGYFRRHPHTGSGQYLSELAARLPLVSPSCELSVFEPKGASTRFSAEQALNSVVINRTRFPTRSTYLSKVLFEQLSLPRAAVGFDVLHYPYWAAPFRSATPVVVTVHDLIPLLLEDYRGSVLARAYTALAALATRRATMVITDSNASKSDIVRHLGLSPARVRVIYLAANERFSLVNNPDTTAEVRRKYGLESPFVFYVGGLDRRKNVDRLIAAFVRVRNSGFDPYVLVIAGDADHRGPLFPDLKALVRNLGAEEIVRFVGTIPEEELPSFYHVATVVAFPSSCEGFGLPPLEGLACGAAVLSSGAASVREVVGDAAMLVEPDDEGGWTAALTRALGDGELRAALRRRAPRQAARFSWRKTALETAEAYGEARRLWSRRCGS